MSHLRAENVRYEVANVAGNVTKMWGALSPQFLFGGTMDPLVPPTFLLHHLCASSTNMSGVIIMAFKVYCGFMLFNMIRLSRRGNFITLVTLGPSPPQRTTDDRCISTLSCRGSSGYM